MFDDFWRWSGGDRSLINSTMMDAQDVLGRGRSIELPSSPGKGKGGVPSGSTLVSISVQLRLGTRRWNLRPRREIRTSARGPQIRGLLSIGLDIASSPEPLHNIASLGRRCGHLVGLMMSVLRHAGEYSTTIDLGGRSSGRRWQLLLEIAVVLGGALTNGSLAFPRLDGAAKGLDHNSEGVPPVLLGGVDRAG